MINRDRLSKLGIGTWGIGGFADRNPENNDEKQVEALVYALNKGCNFAELSYWYAEGAAIDLFHRAQVKSGINRNKLFYFLSIYDRKQPTISSISDEIEKSLNILGTDYIDSLQLTLSFFNRFGFDKIVKFYKWALGKGIAKFVSINSSNLDYLRNLYQVFGKSFFSHELHFSFEIRDMEDLGIIKYADRIGVKNIVFQPLRRNRTTQRNWPMLVDLAKKYHKTQNQILLNWMVSKGLRLLNKSVNKIHIDENLAALEFIMDAQDLDRLNNFRPPDYVKRPIDWLSEGNATPLYMLPNLFDEWYPKV
jgi:diketogulonate reductase-like aldo/keto reductase